MFRHLSLCLSLAALCACDALPSLPSESGERVPAEVRFTGLTIAEGFEGAGDAVNNDQILAGTAVQAGATVLAQDGLPLAGTLVQFGLKTERWREVFKLPQGASCVTNGDGTCFIILSNEGPAGAVDLEIKVPGLAPQVEALVVVPDASQAQVNIEVSGLGSFDWETGQVVDPLAGEDTLMVLDRDQASGNLVQVRLRDQYGNALPGRTVRLAVLQDGEEPPVVPDAGPAGDVGAGAEDAGAAADTGAVDSGPIDSGTAADTGQSDAGRAGDAGMKPLSLEPSDRRAKVGAPSESGTCPSDGLSAAQTELVSDDDGVALFCLLPGDELGLWTLSVDPGALFRVADMTAMALAGETRAGAPEQIRYVLPEGQAEARLWCNAGQLSDVAVFRVENEAGPVPRVRVAFDAEGGLDGLSTRLQVTDQTGTVRVEAICPRRLLTGGLIVARLAETDSVTPASVAVEVIANAITRVELSRHGAWPDTVRSGAELGVRVRAFDADDLPVLRAGLRPEEGQEDTRQPLQFRFAMASVGHAEALRVVGSGQSLVSEVVTIDPETGAADLTVQVSSRATYSNPIQLRAQPVGSEVSDQVSINVAPGDPAQLVVSPAGVVEALLGGAAGELTYTVLDGVGDAANAVPNVPVRITAPQSLVLAANWTNAQTFTGTTGPDGRFRVTVVRATEAGDALVTGAMTTQGGLVTAETIVRVGEGAAASLAMTLDGQALPQEEGLPTLTMRAGTALTQTLALRVLNTQGAGLENRGLSIVLEAGESCAQFAEAGVTDESGTIRFGQGALALTAGGNTGTCVYRLAHGATPANARLRIVQIPGPPVIATLTAAEVRSLANYAQSPNEWTDETSVVVTLQARDANNLAPGGLRMWLDVSNCFVQTRAFELDENGEASFRVAGGNQEGQDCSLRARYFNEVDNYITRAANGRPAVDDETAEQVAARDRLLIQTSGFVAPDLQEVGFGNETSFVMTRNGSHEWSIVAGGLRYPNLLQGGDCAPAAECTTAQIVVMERDDDGALQVRLVGGEPQIIASNISLRYVFGDQGNFTTSVNISDRSLGAGRWLGIRLKHPGDDGAVSNAKTFYAIPPMQWTGAGEAGAGSELTITLPAGEEGELTMTIEGGLRTNLDADDADELLVCGTDGRGGWFTVIHLDANGALPSDSQQAVRSWAGVGYVAPTDNRFACAIADLDNDQVDDLIVLAAKQNGYPSFVLHRGTQDAQVFRAQGERMVWTERALRNANPRTMKLEVGPSAVVVCLANSLDCGSPKRFLMNITEQSAEAAGFEAIDAFNIPKRSSIKLSDHHFFGGLNRTSLSNVAVFDGDSNGVTAVAFSPDGQTLVTGGIDHTLKVRNSSTGALIRTLTGHTGRVNDLAMSPNGEIIASGNLDHTIKLWNASSGAVIRTLTEHTNQVYKVAFSPDGQTLASASYDHTVKLWNVSTGALLRTLTGHTDMVFAATFSPDGQTLASAGRDQTIRLWTVSTGNLIDTRLGGDDRDVMSVAFSPDGAMIASGSASGTIRLWDTLTGDLIHTLSGHSRDVSSLSFHPDGQVLASSSYDQSVRLWDVASGANQSTILGHTAEVWSVAFSPDGRSLVSGGTDDQIQLVKRVDGTFETVSFLGIGEPFPGQSENTYLAAYEDDRIRLKRPYTWRLNCGDSVVDEGELFDNGQPWAGDEYATQCGATCGDGVVQNGEDCDDANESNADACANTCQAYRCGDGIVRQDIQPGEEGYEACDDENDDRFDGCGSDCNRCGDGVIGVDETCDDANEVDQDGCTSCVLDTCGDGQVSDGEQCDDGNNVSEDACARCLNNCPPNSEIRLTGGEFFCFTSSPVTWDSAQQVCSVYGKDLVHIENVQTNDWLHQTAQNLGWDPAEFWIGARDDGEMRWVSQDNMSFIHWGGGQPNPNAQACVIMMPNSQWADIECDNEMKFVCR